MRVVSPGGSTDTRVSIFSGNGASISLPDLCDLPDVAEMGKHSPRNSTVAETIADIVNSVLLPLKLIVPQPLIAKIPGLTTNKEIRAKAVLRYISPDMILLDIGCGDNALVKMHRANGGLGIGADVFQWPEADLVVEDSSNLPFCDRKFDCMTFVASLNHIPNRIDALKETHRLLKDDGIVILTMLPPFVSRIWHAWAFWDKDQRERGMKEGEVFGFTPAEIKKILQKADFHCVDSRKFSWGMNYLLICKKRQTAHNSGHE